MSEYGTIYISEDGAVLQADMRDGFSPPESMEASPARAIFAGRVLIAHKSDGSVRGAHLEAGTPTIRLEEQQVAPVGEEPPPEDAVKTKAVEIIEPGALGIAQPLDAVQLSVIMGRAVEIAGRALTPDDVRAEAARQMRELLGARNARHMDVIISNGQREALRLLRKGEAAWTPEEAARMQELERLDLAIEAIRAASNELEAMEPVPDDYADMMGEMLADGG